MSIGEPESACGNGADSGRKAEASITGPGNAGGLIHLSSGPNPALRGLVLSLILGVISVSTLHTTLTNMRSTFSVAGTAIHPRAGGNMYGYGVLEPS
jgi:hypothetical protein